ncbi:MAG: fused MFS/spermidine synthase, partial [Planctomycetes bacterium]|nr:fused MFS/spermidine synthase [Planctomycetota bacterium]
PPTRISRALFRPVWGVAALMGVATAAGLVVQVKRLESSHRLMVRDFYGALRVKDRHTEGGAEDVRILLHGIINHGEQFLDPARRRQPTSYFAPYSGAALAITRVSRPDHQRVGVLGLGTGTLAAYGRAGDTFRYYEICPLIADLARTQFSFLADSPASTEVILGDGRLSLEREADQHFDVLVIDAFSGDSVPTHLLTREAFAVYRRHLEPGGVLVVHITNRMLDLSPIVAQAAADLGLKALLVQALPDKSHFWRGSTWVLLLDRPETIALSKEFNTGRELVPEPGRARWTDDHTDLFGVLKW